MKTRSAPLVLLLLMAAVAASSASARWSPPIGTAWQWQLDKPLDFTVDAPVYDVDAFETTAHQVERLHSLERHVICYVNAGAWERFRPDKDTFPNSVLGRALDGWPGERWLDIRRIDLLAPIMKARIARCARKGFDAVEPDNIDGYQNRSGFPLSGSDQLRYNRWFARHVHRKGMSVALKNDLGQVKRSSPTSTSRSSRSASSTRSAGRPCRSSMPARPCSRQSTSWTARISARRRSPSASAR